MAMEQAPPAAQAPAEDGAPQEGGAESEISSLITNLGTGMQMLMDVIQASGAPQPLVQKAGALLEGFSSLADDIAAGGQTQGGGASKLMPQEAGGAAASPANPAMRG